MLLVLVLQLLISSILLMKESFVLFTGELDPEYELLPRLLA